MIRPWIALAVAMLAASPAAHADDAKGKPLPPYKPGKPDRWAVYGGEEANLEGTGIRSGFAFAGMLPGRHVRKVGVVTFRLAFFRLAFFSKVPTTTFISL